MAGYGQFCAIAQAAEVLTERWTPLVIRELVLGSRRFNEIQHGVPLISSSLLTQRLRMLEAVGVVERRLSPAGGASEYHLTAAGEELRPIVELMGVWGERWVRRTVSREDADAALLMWAIRRSVRADAVPDGRTVVHFRFAAAPKPKRCRWLVLETVGVDLCLTDPGYGTDLTVRSDPVVLAALWLGDVELGSALRRRAVALDGLEHLVRTFPRWFGLSALAGIERPRPAVDPGPRGVSMPSPQGPTVADRPAGRAPAAVRRARGGARAVPRRPRRGRAAVQRAVITSAPVRAAGRPGE